MFRKQPEIIIEPTEGDKKIILTGWILLILNALLTAIFYVDLPEKIPTHFNINGEVDRYGHKSTIWIISILGFILYYIFSIIIKKVPPHKYNYPVKVTNKNAPTVYGLSLKMLVILNFLIALLFLFISIHIILLTKNLAGPNLIQIVSVGGIFIAILPFFFIYKMFKISK